MRRLLVAAPLVLLPLLATACVTGVGAMTAAGNTALVTNSERDNNPLLLGASVGAMPSLTFTTFDDNPPGSSLSWTFHAGANLSIGGLGGAVEYQFRNDQWAYAGRFRGGSQAHGVMAYFSVAPLPFLSVDLGGGGLFGGTFGLLGNCGEVFGSCETSAYSGPASGGRAATRINLNLVGPSSFWGMLTGSVRDPSTGLYTRTSSEGPILPITTSVRVELGYQRLGVSGAAPLPRQVEGLNIGVELLLGFL